MPDSPHASTFATDAELLQSGFRYALALSHGVEDAEDLVQQAWLNLCTSYGRVESRAVLFTAVRHLFIDQCRRRKIVQFDALDEATVHGLPAESAEEPGVKGDLETLLAVLRPAERETLFLHYYQGHTAEEIGQLTSQPRNTVLSLLHRAIGKLRAAATASPLQKFGNHLAAFFVTFL
jgi:RNA polymerase sigma-70 factor (ECF subfamily)